MNDKYIMNEIQNIKQDINEIKSEIKEIKDIITHAESDDTKPDGPSLNYDGERALHYDTLKRFLKFPMNLVGHPIFKGFGPFNRTEDDVYHH